MKATKKLLSILLSLLMVMTILPANAVFTMAAAKNPSISVESTTAIAGSTIEVNVSIKDNPGILGAILSLSYDDGLTLVNASSGDAFSALSMTRPGRYVSPCKFTWDGLDLDESDIKDGIILTLTFQVSESLSEGDSCAVNLSCKATDIQDINLNPVTVSFDNGFVNIIDFTYGDINDDGMINMTDVIFLRRHLAGGYEIEINEKAADVNCDKTLNMTDVIGLRRHLAGGYTEWETLPFGHTHNLTKIEAVEATCTEDGHTAYWKCAECNKFYSDANGGNQLTDLDSTIIEATGHDIVIDAAVAPTYDEEGLTEGSHCSRCGTVIVAQTTIPTVQKDEYSITYHLSDNDVYLESLDIENNNPSTYTKQDGLRLLNLKVDGYVFEGWYDGQGANGELVKNIPAGTTGSIELFAKWTPVTYNINFDNTGLFNVDSRTYKVNEDCILPTPKLDGYAFAGWSDDEGNIITRIEAGSTYGHKTYNANWISERNKAETFKKISDPTVYEDDERILFTYYIGKINNVPLNVIKDFGYINEDGVTKTVTETYTETVDDTQMRKFTNTVQNSTTSSYGWSLADSWTDSTTIDEGWLQETGRTVEEVNEISRNESNNWYVSSGTSGSSTISSMNSSDSYANQSSVNNINVRNKTQVKTDDTVSASLKSTVSAEVGAGYGPISAKVGTSVESGMSAVSNVKTDRLQDVRTNDTYTKNSGTSTHAENSASNTSSWNSSSGFGGSSSTTQNHSVSEAVSEKLSKNYNLQTSYLKSNTKEETQGHEESSSNADEYSSAVTYSTIVGTEKTETYTTANTKTGYHRWVLAGTAHVFGQVGYDIASKSYFVTTFTMMDDETHQFEDYSYRSAAYDDFENTVIPFEVPMDINEYVANRVCESEGIEVDKNGTLTRYFGTDKDVIVPEYKVIDNQDGTKTVVRISAISPTAFAGKDITSVELSNFVTEIPAHAFENCTQLTHVNALGVTKIGDSAFAGCTSIEELQICEQVTELGENVVSNETSLFVCATNKSVVEAAVNSNARSIAISILDECTDLENTELVVPATTERFLINGFGATFNNVRIKSDAQKTIINRASFNNTGAIPLVLSSDNVELHEVSINSSGIGLALTNVLTNLSLRGNCYINSNSENSLLCKNMMTNQIDSNLSTILRVNGNILTCGGISESISLISCNGQIITIDQEMFDKYLKGQFNVIFDPCEGTVSETTREMFYGEEIGELPVPEKDFHRFDGWYTAPEGGDKINENTTFDSAEDVTLYARWIENTEMGWVLASELPDDAVVTKRKYEYTLRSYTTSGSSSMSGWTKYDTQRTSWGSTQGPVYSNPSNGSRNVWSEKYVSSKTTHYKYYHRWNGSGTWGSRSTAKTWTEHNIDITYQLTKNYTSSSSGITWYKTYTCSKCGATGMWIPDGTYTSDNYDTRWYYQEPVYTYYYYKDEKKEATTDPTGQSNVSNVKEWVMYREK